MNLNKSIELQKLELEQLEQLEQLELEQDINDIHEIYKNVNEIINAQGELLNNICDNIENANNNTIISINELKKADEYYKSYKKYTYILTGITLLGTLLLIL